MIKVPAQRKWL